MSQPTPQPDEADPSDAEKPLPFAIGYSYDAEGHVRQLPAAQRSLLIDRVNEQLTHQPNLPTRHRKPLRKNTLAPWQLRIGNLRVFYDFDEANVRSRLSRSG